MSLCTSCVCRCVRAACVVVYELRVSLCTSCVCRCVRAACVVVYELRVSLCTSCVCRCVRAARVVYRTGEPWYCSSTSDFTPDITPLILAAQNEHYGVIRLLLRRGYYIEKPHPPTCESSRQGWAV